ncbi:hypothetical protein [Marinimicrobium sp. C2-29]|uniref:hypothetical protein n=1 Tax=Marinimicrobium sp. C2-29 TaxID=3139825 RepID=UPI0031396691
MLVLLRTLLVTLALMSLAACGGGGGDGSTPPTNNDGGGDTTDDDNTDDDTGDNSDEEEPTSGSRTGTFVDSAVAGITFTNEPSGITGTTDAQGRFTFEPGDTVTFSIGDLNLPSTTARGLVTPLTIAGTDDPNDVVATNIARLLQSLDFDGDASNGIDIAGGAADVATAVDFSADDFDDQVAELVANSGSSNTSLVSAEDARAHLQTSLNEVRARAIGSWYYVDTSAADVEEQFVIVLTLMSDGRFALFNDEDWPEMDGFEVGDIGWNISNGQITLDNVRDYSGEIGFAGGTCESEEDNQFTLDLVSGNSLGDDKLLLGADTGVGEGCDAEGDGAEVIEFTRLYSDTDGRVGTWFMEDADEFLMLHLFADGMFAYLEEDTDPQSLSAGIERGTYSIDAETNAVTWTVVTDTNGDSGFSHPCPDLPAGETGCGPDGGDIQETLTFDADSNTLVFGTNAPDEEPEAFTRVGPTGVEVGTSGDSGSGGDTTLDISGTWTFDINDSTDVVECEDDRIENFVVVQTGTDLEVTDEGGHNYSGSLSGSSLVWTGSYPEDGGTTETSLEATVTADGAGSMSMSGSSAWSFTMDGETDPYCSGTSTFTGTLN